MATASSLRAPSQKWSLNDLSSELLALILEQVRRPSRPQPDFGGLDALLAH